MHSFNWKILLRVVCFCLVLVMLFEIFNYTTHDDSTYTRIMMHEMYTENTPIEVVFAGGSVAYRNFDPEQWDQALGMHTFNIGSSSQTPDATYFVMKELFKQHSPKFCVYSLNYVSFLDLDNYDNPRKDYILYDYFKPSLNKLAYWLHSFNENTSLAALIPFLRSKSLSLTSISNITHKKASESYRNFAYDLYDSSLDSYQGRGFVFRHEAKKTGNVGALDQHMYAKQNVNNVYVHYFEKLVQLCKKNGCELILVAAPVPYASTALQEDYQEVLDFYDELAERTQVRLFNFSICRPEVFYPEDSYFYDHVHLNGHGAQIFGAIASDILGAYISGQEEHAELPIYSSYQELLDFSPYIFSTWLEKSADSYTAHSTYGSGVIPQYRFSIRESLEGQWQCIQEYGVSSSLDITQIPEEAVQICIEARPEGSTEAYQQYDIVDR